MKAIIILLLLTTTAAAQIPSVWTRHTHPSPYQAGDTIEFYAKPDLLNGKPIIWIAYQGDTTVTEPEIHPVKRVPGDTSALKVGYTVYVYGPDPDHYHKWVKTGQPVNRLQGYHCEGCGERVKRLE